MSFWDSILNSLKLLFSLTALVNWNHYTNQNSTDISTLNKNLNSCPLGYAGENCESECGLSFVEPTKIVGGQISKGHAWPSAVYIGFSYEGYVYLNKIQRYVYVNKSRKFVCGGTLIDRSTVLTAAHCIQTHLSVIYNRTEYTFPIQLNNQYPSLASMYKIYLGVHNRSVTNDPQGITMAVSRVIQHEKYDEINYLNDIGLMKLAYPVQLNRKIQIACLPSISSRNYPQPGKDAWAVGWGTIDFGGPSSELLKMVKLDIYDPVACRYVSTENTKNWSNQICCGDLSGGKDTCQGDSGGALYVIDYVGSKLKYIVGAITSYGDFCALSNSPGIYTRVSAYLDWIYRNI